jgi:hypothetical protein
MHDVPRDKREQMEDHVMRSRLAVVLVLMLGVALVACTPAAHEPPPGPAVAPGQVFPGENLTVTWPTNAEGWHLSQAQAARWSFTKRGAQPDDSWGAVISGHALPPDITTREEFRLFVKQAADADNADRFGNLRSEAAFSDARKYPCVRYRAAGVDALALAQSDGKKKLVLEEQLLVCKNPLLSNVAFAAVYSYRGAAPDPNFDTDADDFFAGIQVPGH